MESDAIDGPRVNQIHGMAVTYRDGVFIGMVQMMEIEDTLPAWNPLIPMEVARFHVQLAVSFDGVSFHRVGDRRAFFSPSEDATAFDYGMVRSGGEWVFHDDRMFMYYDGRPWKHVLPNGAFGNAGRRSGASAWRKRRSIALPG